MSIVINQLSNISHFVEGLLKLNADFAIFFLPFIELSNKQVQLLLELGSLTLSGGSLDFCKLEIQDQVSNLLLGILVAFEGIGFGQLKSFHIDTNHIKFFL